MFLINKFNNLITKDTPKKQNIKNQPFKKQRKMNQLRYIIIL